jgi:hypothetical protein
VIVLDLAPLIVGGVRSNSRPGTVIVPVQVSVPSTSRPGEPATRVSVPLPEAPTYAPVPPVTVTACGDAPGTLAGGMHPPGISPTARFRSPLPATLSRAGYPNTLPPSEHPVRSARKTYVCVTRPSPATTPVPLRAWQTTSLGVPGGQMSGTDSKGSSARRFSVPNALADPPTATGAAVAARTQIATTTRLRTACSESYFVWRPSWATRSR